MAVCNDGDMVRVTNTQFAVAAHVLTYLGGLAEGSTASSAELAESTGSNAVYVRRVLGPLRDAGLVRSRPGAFGGWELAQPPQGISLALVWRLINRGDPVLGIHGPNPQCQVGQQVHRALVALDSDVARAVDQELAGHTVADLLRNVRAPAGRTRR